jgi:hypothetical protein
MLGKHFEVQPVGPPHIIGERGHHGGPAGLGVERAFGFGIHGASPLVCLMACSIEKSLIGKAALLGHCYRKWRL